MATPKKYFHDRVVLLLLSINVFLAFLASFTVLLRLSSGHGSAYITACRDCSNLQAIDRFQNGDVTNILGFIGFALLVLIIHTMLSLRTYHLHRQISIAILGLGILLLTLAIIVSNALLVLR